MPANPSTRRDLTRSFVHSESCSFFAPRSLEGAVPHSSLLDNPAPGAPINATCRQRKREQEKSKNKKKAMCQLPPAMCQ